MPDAKDAPAARTRRRRIWPYVVGAIVLAIAALIFFWNWDWFIPIVDSRASAALGRKVTIKHLHVHLGRVTTVTIDGLTVAEPKGFPPAAPFAQIARLAVSANVLDYIEHGRIVVPGIVVDKPVVLVQALPNGTNNYSFPSSKPSKPAKKAKPSAGPQIGTLEIDNGVARIVLPKLRANFVLDIGTRPPANGSEGQIVVDAKGTYAKQPITGKLVGGAVLTLRDVSKPYPIDLDLANGPTRVTIRGGVQDPLQFAGAKLRLRLTGPSMALLFPLTGIPIPETPPYSVSGDLNYSKQSIRFTDFAGRVGSSDIGGTIAVTPGSPPVVTADLASKEVNLKDLSGFIGGSPVKASEAKTEAQKAALAKAKASPYLLPNTRINIPKLKAATVHLAYTGHHIEGRFVPIDDLQTRIDIVGGKVDVHPLDFGIGSGKVASTISLDPVGDNVHADADVGVEHVSLARIMKATHAFAGSGTIDGKFRLVATGSTIATLMAHGSGGLQLVLQNGGDISALLADLAGLEFGNGLLSALGVPSKAKLDCFVADLPMKDGIMDTRALVLSTSETQTIGKGTIDWRNETLDYSVNTKSKHFSIGSLPGPINITGSLKSPRILPGAEVAARAGAAVGLGVLFPPLAILPTIQFGTGPTKACAEALHGHS